MRILRTMFNGINCYMSNDNGKAVVTKASFHRYLQALAEIEAFEQEVDRQYENSRPSSASSNQ